MLEHTWQDNLDKESRCPRKSLSCQEFVICEPRACRFVFCELQCLRMPIIGQHGMRVISKARLREFWKTPGSEDSEGSLRAWHTHVSHKSVAWQTWGDVRAEFGSASLVGNCVVFNIGGNKYRLVARILYPSQKVFVSEGDDARRVRPGQVEGGLRLL